MNYGHGGHITPHKDSFSSRVDETSCSEHFTYGGQRIVTFMMYLTDIGSKHVISLKNTLNTNLKLTSDCLCMHFRIVYILLKL